jgi:hypothetical protein
VIGYEKGNHYKAIGAPGLAVRCLNDAKMLILKYKGHARNTNNVKGQDSEFFVSEG